MICNIRISLIVNILCLYNSIHIGVKQEPLNIEFDLHSHTLQIQLMKNLKYTIKCKKV